MGAESSYGRCPMAKQVLDEQATGNVLRRFSDAMKLPSLACWNKISPAFGASTPANSGVVPQDRVTG